MTSKKRINKIKDMADLADASYAMLHYVYENIDSIFESSEWKEADNIMFGDKINDNIKDSNDENVILHKKDNNTAYARAIESRFQKDIVIEKGTFKDTIKFFIERVVVRNYL